MESIEQNFNSDSDLGKESVEHVRLSEYLSSLQSEEEYLRQCARKRYELQGHDIDDLVQGVFTRVIDFSAHNPDYLISGGMKGFRRWITQVLKNAYLGDKNLHGLRRGRAETMSDFEFIPTKDEIPVIANPLDIDSYAGFLGDRTMRALRAMPEIFRSPFLLYVFGDLSYKEIGEQLHIPLGTVMSRIHRAKLFLRSSGSRAAE